MRRAALALGLLVAACGGEPPPEAPVHEVELRPEAAGALARPVDDLLADLESADVRIRLEAADRLAKQSTLPPEAVPALARALADENRWVRDRAARALFRLGPVAAPATPALTEALGDEDGYVRWRAAKALSAIGPKASAALERLEEMAAKDFEPGRSWAAQAIRSIRGE